MKSGFSAMPRSRRDLPTPTITASEVGNPFLINAYTLVNLNSRYVVTKNIELFAMGRNIFDEHYASFGQMSNNLFNNNNLSQFQGPGAPATGYAGVRIHWN